MSKTLKTFTFTGLSFSTNFWIMVQRLSPNSKCAPNPGFTICGLLRTWRTGACRLHNLSNILKVELVEFHRVATSSTSSRLFSPSCSCCDLKAWSALEDCLRYVTRCLAAPRKVKIVLKVRQLGYEQGISQGLADCFALWADFNLALFCGSGVASPKIWGGQILAGQNFLF